MQSAFRLETIVLPGHRLELSAPELPEGIKVEVIVVLPEQTTPLDQGKSVLAAGPTPAELRRMPREQRQAILAAAADLAVPDYHFDKELTAFDAFAEEELDDD